MLILTRRISETINIGDHSTVTILGIKGSLIRIRTTSNKTESHTFTCEICKSIEIDKDTYITPLSVKGMQVRLGIDAPREIPVHREEIYQRIQEEKRRANHSASTVA